jgi:uncharacterized membrane protein YkgB
MTALDNLLDDIFVFLQRIARPFLRITMGFVVLWIAALKFVDPGPVLGLLKASFPFLASNAFVYVLGVFEIIAALSMFTGIAAKYGGLLLMALFVGTMAIFVIAPSVTYGQNGFPLLSLAGQFLLKDLVLFAAAATIVAMESAHVNNMREARTPAMPMR